MGAEVREGELVGPGLLQARKKHWGEGCLLCFLVLVLLLPGGCSLLPGRGWLDWGVAWLSVWMAGPAKNLAWGTLWVLAVWTWALALVLVWLTLNPQMKRTRVLQGLMRSAAVSPSGCRLLWLQLGGIGWAAPPGTSVWMHMVVNTTCCRQKCRLCWSAADCPWRLQLWGILHGIGRVRLASWCCLRFLGHGLLLLAVKSRVSPRSHQVHCHTKERAGERC